jgi:regulatory protein
MPIISRLENKISPTGKAVKVRVYLDGQYTLSLEPEAAAGLKLGQEIDTSGLAGIEVKNERLRCLTAAYRYLANRPHSEHELSQKLGRRFGEETVNFTLADLKDHNFLNDADFARYWCESREAFKPRSRRLTGLELRQKGITPEQIEAVTSTLDDAGSAYRSALKKAALLKSADYDVFQRKIGDYLRRRGYSYEIILHTIKTLWQEKSI